MATQAESRLSRKIMTEMRINGIFCFKVHGSALMMAGLPDIICCVDGIFLGLETKMPGHRKNTSARQDYVHSLIEASDGLVYVVTSVQEALDAVKKARKLQRRIRQSLIIENSPFNQSVIDEDPA